MSSIFQSENYTIYHYTDINALVNIIRDDCILLRATNCMYLNDSHEIIEGTKAVQRVTGIVIEPDLFKNYYLTSFSKTSDQLNMWGMYASNGNGCAIGFDYSMLSEHYLIVTPCTYGDINIDSTLYHQLKLAKTGCVTHFGPNHKEEQTKINNNITDIRKGMMNNLIIANCVGAKHEAYKNEEEIRCVACVNDNKYVKFRTKNGIIIPYVEIMIPKMALKSIIVGPTNKSELSKQSILHFLSINGYDIDNIDLKTSQIPYRG